MTILWSLVFAAIVITLLVMEQVAILYVLATLGIALLLIVVALSNLKGAHATTLTEPPLDDAAAISDGIAPASPTLDAAPRRRTKNR